MISNEKSNVTIRQSRVKKLWENGQAAICFYVKLNDPLVSELASMLGFDCVWIDQQHQWNTDRDIAAHVPAAAKYGSDVMVRPGKGEFASISRLLECGASGVLYPNCDSAQEAAEVVKFGKFAPLGRRSIDGSNADNPFGLVQTADYIREINMNTFLGIQIESPEGVACINEICAVEGIDMVFFGANDYSCSIGLPGQNRHRDVVRAWEKVCETTVKAGKQFGMYCSDLEQVTMCLDKGATLVLNTGDTTLLKSSAGQALNDLRRTIERTREVL